MVKQRVQAEKLEPQPQVDVAFGFLITFSLMAGLELE